MIKDINVKETPKGSNRGDSIDKWTRQYGFTYPVAWCGIVIGIKLRDNFATPKIMSASARAYAVKKYSYQLSDVIYNNYTPKVGDLRVKLRKGGGHVDMVMQWDTANKKGLVIGGNVNDKISVRPVTIQSMIADRTTHIVDIQGYYNYSISQPKKQIQYDTINAIGTWYNLHGRRTASGEIFDKTKLTVAHKTIKLGTYATIEYKGKQCKVKVNDRCPKRGVLDMSPAVRDNLKFKSGKVKILINK